jgi:hypothetical protein
MIRPGDQNILHYVEMVVCWVASQDINIHHQHMFTQNEIQKENYVAFQLLP